MTFQVAVLNSLASGHFNPARRIVKAVADKGGHIHYFTEVEKQASNLRSICQDKVTIHSYFPTGEVDGCKWFSPDAPSNSGWYNAGVQVWEFGKRSEEAAQRTLKWMQWLISYIGELKVDVIMGEMHAPWAKVVAKTLNLPYVTMCPMRLWNVQECLLQICSEMDGETKSCWYNPIYNFVHDELDTDNACKADPLEYHKRLYNRMEEVLQATSLYQLIQKEFGITLTYCDKSWCDPVSCMFMGGYSSFNIQFSGEVFANAPSYSDSWFPNVAVWPVGPYMESAAAPGGADPEVEKIMKAVEQSTDETPIVFVALGTVDSDNVALFKKVVSELCTNSTSYLVIVRCGTGTSPDDILSVAERKTNCFVTNKFLPQQAILARTSVFLTHCGMGSLNEAVAVGAKCLLFPTDIERYGNAVIMDRSLLGTFLLPDVRNTTFHSGLNYFWQEACTKLDNVSIASVVAELIASGNTELWKKARASAMESTVGKTSATNLEEAVKAVMALKGKTYLETEGVRPASRPPVPYTAGVFSWRRALDLCCTARRR